MVFRMTWLGKVITQNTVWALEKLRLAPEGTFDVGEALKIAADALVAGGQEKLFTPMRKPKFLCDCGIKPSKLIFKCLNRALRLPQAGARKRPLTGLADIHFLCIRCTAAALSAGFNRLFVI
jgi:hypothetical protein